MFKYFLFISIFISIQVFSQDTLKKQTIEITSVFKPVIKMPAKINFSAGFPDADTSRPRLSYSIPVQAFNFKYQPLAINPLALNIDSTLGFVNSNFVKLGYGNFQTPFLKAGFSFGNTKKSSLQIFANHLAQTGNLKNQQFSNTSFEVLGNTVSKNVVFDAKAGYSHQTYYAYGIDTSSINLPKSSLKQNFQTFAISGGVKNATVNAYKINYHPQVHISVFSDNKKASETNARFSVPTDKFISDAFTFHLDLNADLTSFSGANNFSTTNNIYAVNAALQVKQERFSMQVGILPTWNKNEFSLLPDVQMQYAISKSNLYLFGEWKGFFIKNNYLYLASMNPWVVQPRQQFNTKAKEFVLGLRGSVEEKFSFQIDVANQDYTNLALLVNDSLSTRNFVVRNEENLKAFRLRIEAGYLEQNRFEAKASIQWRQFSDLKSELKAWHLIPFELNASIRWMPVKDVWVKGNLFLWDGAQYLRGKESFKLKPAADFNAEVEYRVANLLHIFTRFNNMFNNTYQRWNGYEVLGFQFIGGVIINFAQSNK